MSMLSVQCDNLRIMARLVRDYDHAEVSRELRDAADTIWSLRNRCVDVQAENDDLRDENAKLRELVMRLITCNDAAMLCDYCPMMEHPHDAVPHCPNGDEIKRLRSELGMETET